MAIDFIPRPDGGFDAWQQNFVTYTAAHYVEWDLDSTVVTELLVARGNWEFVHGKHVAAQAAAIAARQAKDEGRRDYDQLIRAVVRRIQAHVKTSDAQRGHLGITIADRQATPVGAPTLDCLVSDATTAPASKSSSNAGNHATSISVMFRLAMVSVRESESARPTHTAITRPGRPGNRCRSAAHVTAMNRLVNSAKSMSRWFSR